MISMQAPRSCAPYPMLNKGIPMSQFAIQTAVTSHGRVNLHVSFLSAHGHYNQAAIGDVAAAAGCMKVLASMQSSLMSPDICA